MRQPDSSSASVARVSLPSSQHLLVDVHVHLHVGFGIAQLLGAAADNLGAVASMLGMTAPPVGCLVVAEIAGDGAFDRLRNCVDKPLQGGWRIVETSEPESLLGRRDRAGGMALLDGQQLVSSEGIEVLAIATRARFAGGVSLRWAVEEIIDSGSVAVIPWGFGKWWFSRRKVLSEMLHRVDRRRLFLADSGTRWRWAPRPQPFAWADECGVGILHGSDPLPLASHVGRAGSFGSVVPGALDLRRPAADLLRLLGRGVGEVRSFGRRRSLPRFASDQGLMQLVKPGLHG